MSDYEPHAEMVADEVRALNATLGVTYIQQAVPNMEALRRIAVRNLRRQHEREFRLLAELKWIANSACAVCAKNAHAALAAHAKLDAPKVPTLRELHEAFTRHEAPDTIRPLIAALVERAEKDGGR